MQNCAVLGRIDARRNGGDSITSRKKPGTAQSDVWQEDEADEDSIATRVKELREYKGWSQTQLADKLGVVRSQISRLESGETKKLHSDLLVKLAKVFDVTTDYLLGLSTLPRSQTADIERLGLSEGAIKKLLSGNVDCDVVNRLLESNSFGTLSKQIRIYFDDSNTDGFLGRNELLNFGASSLKDFAQQHPDQRDEINHDIQQINAEKITADEYNMGKISSGFQKV